MDTVVRALGLAPKFVLVSQMLLVFSMGPELDAEGPRGQWTILNLTASDAVNICSGFGTQKNKV